MFEIILMAAAGNNVTSVVATPLPPVSESISGLVNAVSLLVGAVVPLIIAVFSYVKAKSHDPKIDQAMNTGIAVGRIATATANDNNPTELTDSYSKNNRGPQRLEKGRQQQQ